MTTRLSIIATHSQGLCAKLTSAKYQGMITIIIIIIIIINKFIFRYDVHFYTRTPKIWAHSSTRTKQDLGTILWAIDENIGTNLQALYIYMTKKHKLYVIFFFFSIRAGRYVNRAGHKGIRAGRKTVRAGRSTLRNMHSWNTGCAHSLCPGDAVPVCLQVPAAGRACVAGPGGLVW